ncbi:uncharacterized protein N7458_008880 [Penicillium daleae]|uniref:Uncharacterized protein n=1 Tax=Penicillium daleae TaxID=63821 RepID=A0AAD6BWC0_9EURO|nr:uncharacterized protein N7458_008880 [Penicillium daleae]KAJ5437882.1 hypothetical protein N7458_008880 [Penicillium daleae]
MEVQLEIRVELGAVQATSILGMYAVKSRPEIGNWALIDLNLSPIFAKPSRLMSHRTATAMIILAASAFYYSSFILKKLL